MYSLWSRGCYCYEGLCCSRSECGRRGSMPRSLFWPPLPPQLHIPSPRDRPGSRTPKWPHVQDDVGGFANHANEWCECDSFFKKRILVWKHWLYHWKKVFFLNKIVSLIFTIRTTVIFEVWMNVTHWIDKTSGLSEEIILFSG